MKKKLSRIIAIITVLAMVLALSGCNKAKKTENTSEDTTAEAPSDNKDDSENKTESSNENGEEDPEVQKAFADFVDKQYIESIESSYFTMHIYYTNPEAAGINLENVDITLGEAFSPENAAEDRATYKSLKEEIQTFDRSKLSPRQKDEYDSLEWEIDTVLKILDEKFDYYEQSFAPPNSLEANMLSYLTSYEIRNEREANEIAQLINAIPGYVDSHIAYAKVQQEKELFLGDFDAVIEGCDDILESGTESYALSSLKEDVDELSDVSDEDKEKYKNQITEAYENSFLPSVQKIKDAMEEMKDGYCNTEGYAKFPNGKEYYETLLNYSLGLSGQSVDDIRSYLEARNEKHMNDFYKVLMSDPSIMEAYSNNSEPTTGYEDYNKILMTVRSRLTKDYPDVKNLDYNVQPADKEEKLAEKNIAAYFLIPPLDGDHKQQMRVAPENKNIDSIESYATITHEGFPGHMYQYAYAYENIDSEYINTLGVDGTVEGYAVYSQYHALDYLDSVSEGNKKLYRANNELIYILYGLVDIGINYDGWTLQETKDYFNDAGYALDDETVLEIYDYLRCTPTSYTPYSYGYEVIEELRENAEEKLGDKFDAIAFNTALLDAGPTPYVVVKNHIDAYVNSAK